MNLQHFRQSGHHSLWYGLLWVFALFTLVQGGNYTYAPTNKTYSPSFYEIRHLFDGHGITVFGACMLAMSALFFLGLGSFYHPKIAMLALRVFCGACAAVVVTIIASWTVYHQPASLGALSVWVAFAAVSGLAVRFPPHQSLPHDSAVSGGSGPRASSG